MAAPAVAAPAVAAPVAPTAAAVKKAATAAVQKVAAVVKKAAATAAAQAERQRQWALFRTTPNVVVRNRSQFTAKNWGQVYTWSCHTCGGTVAWCVCAERV